MKYTIRFFTHNDYGEKFLKEYEFGVMPYIPRKKDLISIDEEQYLVKRVATEYEEVDNQLFEIMLDVVDYDKKWWE